MDSMENSPPYIRADDNAMKENNGEIIRNIQTGNFKFRPSMSLIRGKKMSR